MNEHEDFTTYAVSICNASVCTSMSLKDATKMLNIEHPTGISSRWEKSNNKTFASGETNPCPCEDNPETHQHYLFVC